MLMQLNATGRCLQLCVKLMKRSYDLTVAIMAMVAEEKHPAELQAHQGVLSAAKARGVKLAANRKASRTRRRVVSDVAKGAWAAARHHG